jgi:hypothetical protein
MAAAGTTMARSTANLATRGGPYNRTGDSFMPRDWEATFANWGTPPSASEQEKADNAERVVRTAINNSTTLQAKEITVFTQGSYKNRTNVRQDSDVDVCVLYKGAHFADYNFSQGLSRDVLGFVPCEYTYEAFKNDVAKALTNRFGTASVTRGKKAFEVHENTYRLNADVVPCFQHRRYLGDAESNWFLSGTELHPDGGGAIINWPAQNYDNGVAKNDRTGRQFKAVTRMLKRLRYELIDAGNAIAKNIPSYLIECLVWNVPDLQLNAGSAKQNVRSAITHLWLRTQADDDCSSWGEINELKYLFRSSQPWTRADVNAFLLAAYKHVGFE